MCRDGGLALRIGLNHCGGQGEFAGDKGQLSSTERVDSPQSSTHEILRHIPMQWSKRGAHLLLHIRVKTRNRALGSVYKSWYPDMEVEEAPDAA